MNDQPQELSAETLQELLNLAHNVVVWTGQATIRTDAAGYPHLVSARQAYYRARINAIAKMRPLRAQDYPGCSCRSIREERSIPHKEVDPDCLYHYAASLQPDNHQIPWNCPTYYDGCNCNQT